MLQSFIHFFTDSEILSEYKYMYNTSFYVGYEDYHERRTFCDLERIPKEKRWPREIEDITLHSIRGGDLQQAYSKLIKEIKYLKKIKKRRLYIEIEKLKEKFRKESGISWKDFCNKEYNDWEKRVMAFGSETLYQRFTNHPRGDYNFYNLCCKEVDELSHIFCKHFGEYKGKRFMELLKKYHFAKYQCSIVEKSDNEGLFYFLYKGKKG